MLYERSYARITLALDIVRKLTEGPYRGYHELHTIKHSIDLFDTIGIEESDFMALTCNREGIPCDERNLCWKAVELIRTEYGIKPCARIELNKRVPAGGGLAGGSSNAATVLALCNRLWKLGLTFEEFRNLGKRLGMDVPYYFAGGTAFDTEATGILLPIPTAVSLSFVLVLPDFGVSTASAYGNLDYSEVGRNQERTDALKGALTRNQITECIRNLHNDFEYSVFRSHPQLAEIKKALLDAGCEGAWMTGSGSTMVGVTRDRESALSISRELPYTVHVVSTRGNPVDLSAIP